jgi:integrase
MRHDSVRTEEA